jgi:serine/threonine protein kinase
LKPDNILVSFESKIKIADFGAARYAAKEYCVTTTKCGTFGYMAPEYLNYGLDSTKIDTWALGVIAYLIITGCFPFEDSDPLNDLSNLNLSIIENQNAKWLIEKVCFYLLIVEISIFKFILKLLKFEPRERIDLEQVLKSNWILK